jgi:hypothetical protein
MGIGKAGTERLIMVSQNTSVIKLQCLVHRKALEIFFYFYLLYFILSCFISKITFKDLHYICNQWIMLCSNECISIAMTFNHLKMAFTSVLSPKA